jgi:hypothetical protein
MKKTVSLISLILLLYSPVKAQESFTAELMWALGRVSDAQVSPDGEMVLYGITQLRYKKIKANATCMSCLLPVANHAN